MVEKIKVGLVGLGTIARVAHLPSIFEFDDVELTAVCDVTEETLNCVADRYNIRERYQDPRVMAEKSSIDCAFVLTKPDNTHPILAKMFLNAGKHVFCEKPMATTLRDAEQMVETADKTGRILMIGFNRRYASCCQEAKKILRDKKVDACYGHWNYPVPYGRALLLNPHCIDLMRFFCGDAIKVESRARNETPENDLVIMSMVEFDSGVLGSILYANTCGRYSEKMEIYGNGISLFLDIEFDTLTVIRQDQPESHGPSWRSVYLPRGYTPVHVARGYQAQDRHFFDCLKSGKKPQDTAEDAYRSHRLMNDIYTKAGLPPLE